MSNPRPMTPDELQKFETEVIHKKDNEPDVPPSEPDKSQERDREPPAPPPPNPD